jgi:3-hydroxyacyl-CoA dehydrogenase
MKRLVELTRVNGVGIITINNPPVNALSSEVQAAFAEWIAQAEQDDDTYAVVVIGAGRNFVAGADIKEFVKTTKGQTPWNEEGLQPLLRRIEDYSKPVVMAIHGYALGGGLEMAMAGHYRIATPDAHLGLPEVKIGLIPGAGGTQRLPRLVGMAKALEMCYGGEPILARVALNLGLVDQLINGDFLTEAAAFARQIAKDKRPKTRERTDKLGTPEVNAPLFAAARETARTKFRNAEAPLAAVEAIEAATRLSFEAGCQLERQIFKDRLFSEQSRALVHIFFADREVAKVPDIPRDTPTMPIKTAAVVGAGTMGAGIAMVFANAGFRVLLTDSEQAALHRGMTTIQKNYANSVSRERFSQEFVDERLKLIQPVLRYSELAHADIVVEAIYEDIVLKRKVFGELDHASQPFAILASNTSTLNIDELAAATSRPELVIGTHFFSPANVMRLLEVVRGKKTSKETVATCMLLAKRLGKIGVTVGNCRGFVGNRMYHPYRREAQFLVEEGASVQEVDDVLYRFGMAMGPLATGDLAGLDVSWRIRQQHHHLQEPGSRQPFVEDRLCELGRYGQKTGAGWYRYDENRRRHTDPEVLEMVRRWASEADMKRRDLEPQEIVDRCIYSLVNEGARILEEGYALRAGDIDVIYVNGYGFPSYRGGPMWYADTVGLKYVYERICEFRQRHGKLWEPAPLLRQLAEAKQTFSGLVPA